MDGSAWRPTTFVRFERNYDTSIGTARIVTDAGPAYIKPLGNRQGPHVLACEWVGTQLAKWFGLPTLDVAIMDVSEVDEIPLGGDRNAVPGPAFVSRATLGHPWGGSSEELEQLVNPDAIPRLVMFDTWTLNCDRHHPDAVERRPNFDNVFLSAEGAEPGEFRLLAMDHTHCFTCGRDLTRRIASIDRVRDKRVYGLFAPFEALIDKRGVERSVARLGRINPGEVRGMIDTIPAQWQVALDARRALERLICTRAAFLVDTVIDLLDPYFNRTQSTFDWKGDNQ